MLRMEFIELHCGNFSIVSPLDSQFCIYLNFFFHKLIDSFTFKRSEGNKFVGCDRQSHVILICCYINVPMSAMK